MPFARIPFLEEVRELCLSKIHNLLFGDELEQELRNIFERDPYFKREIFQQQMEIVRGQMGNVADALDRRQSPCDLVKKDLILIQKEQIIERVCEPCATNNPVTSTTVAFLKSKNGTNEREEKFKCCCEVKIKWKKIAVNTHPLCSCW